MAEQLIISPSASKEEKYKTLVPQIEALVFGEQDVVANLSNIAAALRQTMNFFWVGFYVVKANELVLGPFQGPIACTRIHFDKGVCGACYRQKQTIIVPDVEAFPGHIACSSASKSEIVLPVFNPDGTVAMVLDVDSDQLNDFNQTDAEGLEAITKIISTLL